MKYILLSIIILIIIVLTNHNSNKEGFENFLRFGYIINLDERTDRLNNIVNHFESYNLPLYRIPAIRDSVGWKGCGYSHISVIKMAKYSNLPSVLILEDDCKPTEYFKNWFIIQEWLENHKDTWDIFTGGNTYYGFNQNDNSIQSLCKLKDIKLYKTKLTSLHFYYVNSSAYDAMLEWEEYVKTNNDWIPIDLWPDRKNIRTVSCTPFIAVQNESYSDIEKTVRNYNSQMKKSEEIIGSVINDSICEPFQNFSTVA
jgi:GR25 family glycosyltransferase involved in LPS biosynthesis